MKWSGQHIYDLISRFRDSVYLEDLTTTTETNVLVVDSAGLVSKSTSVAGDLTSIVAGTGLSGTSLTGPIPTLNVDASLTHVTGVGTIGTGTWQGTVIASGYLDTDTAHLSVDQAFTGAKSFVKIISAVFDGDKSVTPGDGAVIHVDTHDVTDTNTSASGTAAMYTHVNIERPRLLATNASVTTSAAASLYISNAPLASTNQTIDNAYALWVDDGLVKFDGALTVGGTITGDVTGALTGQADTVATIAGLAPNTATTQASQPNITGVGTIGTGVWNGTAIGGNYIAATQPNIDSIGTDGDTLNILSDTLLMSNTTADTPVIKLVNTTDDDQAGQLVFEKLRDDNGVSVGQNLGEIWFRGQDGGTNTQDYAYIVGEIDVSGHGQESGKLILGVANHDGGNGNGLILTGGSADNEIDVTVGLGTASVTTVAGDLTVTNDLTVNGDTTTFSSANADDPTVIIENTRADIQGARLQMKKDRGAAMVQGDRVGEIDFIGEDAGENFTQYGKILVRADVVTEGQESGKMIFQVANHDANLENGLILVGGSEDGEIDVTLGLGANSITTVAGTLTMGSTAALDNSGVVKVVSQPDITTLAGVTAIGTAANALTVTSDQVVFTSAAAGDPLVNIQNTANDATAPRLRFTKNRGGDAVDADNVGEISFQSYDDGTPSIQEYARIKTQVQEAASGEESGLMQLMVANYDGGVQVGLQLIGGSEDGEIDATVGLGANSVVTIPGDISSSGEITASGGTGAGFTVRPNLYWFANCDAVTVSPATNGSLPATNATDVSFAPTHISNADIFTWSAEELTITRAGLYKITYNVTLETGASSTTLNRCGGHVALLRKAAGGTYAVVDGAQTAVYCRITGAKDTTGTASVIFDVTANDVFKIVFVRTGAQTASSKIGTITAGTAWTVEAVS